MAYITKYTYNKLCTRLEIKCDVTLELFLENLLDDEKLFYIFNKKELKLLFIYKMLLIDENNFLVEYYKEVPERVDSFERVFDKGGKLKYHQFGECKMMQNDYLDFSIPKDIQVIGEEAVREYREWFTTNDFAMKIKNKEITPSEINRIFNFKYPNKYGIPPVDENSKMIIIEKPNSSFHEIESEFNLETFREKIESLKVEYDYQCQSPVSKRLSKFHNARHFSTILIHELIGKYFGDNFINNYGLEKLLEKWSNIGRIIEEILVLLRNYILWSTGRVQYEFNTLTLEIFGLACCNSCKNDSINAAFKNIN